jgi:hypothetical protein
MNRYVLCLLLLSVSSIASARDVRLHGANGDGGACPDATPAPAAPATTTAAKPAPTTVGRGKTKAPILFRAGGDDDVGPHTPRWHSFLPGMFR